MSAPVYDPLVLRQGETFRRSWPLPDAVSTSNWRAQCQVREYPGGPLIVDLNGFVVLGTAAIEMFVPAAITAAITKAYGHYDVLLIAEDDVDLTLRAVEGPVTVSMQVTVDSGLLPTGLPWLAYPGLAVQPGSNTYPRGV